MRHVNSKQMNQEQPLNLHMEQFIISNQPLTISNYNLQWQASLSMSIKTHEVSLTINWIKLSSTHLQRQSHNSHVLSGLTIYVAHATTYLCNMQCLNLNNNHLMLKQITVPSGKQSCIQKAKAAYSSEVDCLSWIPTNCISFCLQAPSINQRGRYEPLKILKILF